MADSLTPPDHERLDPRVLEQLKQKSIDEEGKRKGNKLFQWRSDDKGNPKLLRHLGLVIGYMRASRDYDEFHKLLDRGASIPGDHPLFEDYDD